MTFRPPSTARTVQLMAGLMVRRFLNRIKARRTRRKKEVPGEGKRTGTARKSPVGWVGVCLFGLILAFNGVNLSSNLLRNVRNAIGPVRDDNGRFVVTARSYAKLADFSKKFGTQTSSNPEVQLRKILTTEVEEMPATARGAQMDQLIGQFYDKGLLGFKRGNRDNYFLPRLSAWHSTEAAPKVWKTIGALLLLLSATWLCLDFGSGNQDLGRVEWTLEWLFTMPVSAAGLFVSQVFGYASSEPLMWCGAWPMLSTVFASAGWGWWSVALGGVTALYLSILIGSLRVAGETWLRCILAPPRLKNLQALFTVLGMLGLFLLIANVSDTGIAAKLCSWALQLPELVTWLPFVLPARAPAVSGGGSVLAIGMVASVLLFPWLAVISSAWLVRGGLVSVSGVYTGKRRSTKEPSQDTATGAGAIRGIIGKDLRLLLRDRNFLVQTLVIPLLIIGFQLVIHGGIVEAVRTQFQQAAVLAFAVGGYVLIATALCVLSVEGNSLWMLYTFPQSIAQILLRKTKLWAGIAAFYTAAVLIVCASMNQSLHPGDAVFAVLALVGVLIYAFIASGIGILATDPLETEVKRKVRPEMVQLYMILAAMYAHALYAPSAWTRLAQIVLSVLLAFALWQKVRDRAPFLLDPVAAAPPSVSVSDGMIAALAFFVLQGLFQLSFSAGGVPPGLSLFIAFVIAGAIVFALTIYIFWRAKVPGLLISVGLRRRPEESAVSTSKALLFGITGGVFAAAVAYAYLHAIDYFPALQELKNEALKLPADPGWWLPAIAIGAAPLFEEFIFRGLVFRGLRRSTNATLAIIGSAAIFAIVHPAISVLPVFVLGIVAAWTFERSKLLLSAIATHMIYNAAVVAMNWGRP